MSASGEVGREASRLLVEDCQPRQSGASPGVLLINGSRTADDGEHPQIAESGTSYTFRRTHRCCRPPLPRRCSTARITEDVRGSDQGHGGVLLCQGAGTGGWSSTSTPSCP